MSSIRPRITGNTRYKKDVPVIKPANAKVVDNLSVRKVSVVKLKLPKIDVPEKPLNNSKGPLVGVGPRGTIVVSKNSKSTKTFQNWSPKSGVEFIFDSKKGIFVLGNPKNPSIKGRPHNRLVKSIGSEVNSKHIVGGTISKDKNGNFVFTENSGTYGENWTEEIRKQFSEFMEELTEIKVNDKGYQPSEYGKTN